MTTVPQLLEKLAALLSDEAPTFEKGLRAHTVGLHLSRLIEERSHTGEQGSLER